MKQLIVFFICFIFLTRSADASCYCVNTCFFSDFSDIYLEKYIAEALINNHDLKAASYKVEQYRNEVGIKIAKELPNIAVGANYLGTHFPKNDVNIFVRDSAFIVPINASWEADLLLKNADKIRSSKALYKSALANEKGLYISLITDVASTYVNILLYDYLINKQIEIVEDKTQNAFFNTNKYNFGVISLIDLNDIWAEVFSQKIVLDSLFKMQKKALFDFAALLGRSAADDENTINLKRGKIEEFEYKKQIPSEIDYEIISQRPDLIELEEQLKSAKIDITVAKKDFFPKFSITGLMFFDTSGPGNFFAWESTFAALVAGVSQDLFKGGEKIANLKIKKARYYEIMEKYKQKDLDAIKEVSSVLNAIEQDTKSENYSMQQVELEKVSLEAAKMKLDYGSISKLEYLQTKNSFNQKEQIAQISKASRLVDYFSLYKALGGWI